MLLEALSSAVRRGRTARCWSRRSFTLFTVFLLFQCRTFRAAMAFATIPPALFSTRAVAMAGPKDSLHVPKMSLAKPAKSSNQSSHEIELAEARQTLAKYQAAVLEQQSRIRRLEAKLSTPRDDLPDDEGDVADKVTHPQSVDYSSQEPVQTLPQLQQIATIATCFPTKNGCPRQGSICPSSAGRLKITFGNNPHHTIDGITDFSHLWLLFLFHDNGRNFVPRAKVYPPRLHGKPKGVFATRAPHRPNCVGLTLCRLDRVEGDTLWVSGVDLVDGTPILDIKPFIPAYDFPHGQDVRCPAWALPSAESTLAVAVSAQAAQQLQAISDAGVRPSLLPSWGAVLEGLKDVLAADPRSVYRKQKCVGEPYPLYYDGLNVWSSFDDAERRVTINDVSLRNDTAPSRPRT